MKITILGCGSSGGVPLIGCECAVCTSPNPKNKRSRVSILIQSETTTILVDTSPDMREQALRNNVRKIDAVIYTHAHADHMHGIDDLRSFNFAIDAPLNIYSDAHTLKDINDKFSYVFLPPKPARIGWYRPCLIPNVIEPSTSFTIGDIEVKTFWQSHGGMGKTLGIRIGNFAYSTDTNELDEAAFKALEGLDTWLVDCLRYLPAPTHAHLDLTLGWIKQVKPRKAYLTHMNHEFEYEAFSRELPENIYPSYDGLVLEV